MSEIRKELELLLDQEESNLTVVGKKRLSELLEEAEKYDLKGFYKR